MFRDAVVGGRHGWNSLPDLSLRNASSSLAQQNSSRIANSRALTTTVVRFGPKGWRADFEPDANGRVAKHPTAARRLFNDFIGAGENQWRDGDAKRFRGLEVDDQLKPCRLGRTGVGAKPTIPPSARNSPHRPSLTFHAERRRAERQAAKKIGSQDAQDGHSSPPARDPGEATRRPLCASRRGSFRMA